MSSFLNNIGDFVSMVGNGVNNFVDFIIKLPELMYDLIDIIPNPLYSIVISFVGFLIFVIFIKVVRMLVG